MAEPATAWAFITPSYSGDFRRCSLLCRSMDAFVKGNWHHYIVVDRPDRKLFAPLAGARRTILQSDDVLPEGMRFLFHVPFSGGRSLWWSGATGPSLGWHMQQMVKIAMASSVSEAGLAYCDSDIFFLKRFDVSGLVRDGRFRLFRLPGPFTTQTHPNANFLRTSVELLGLPPEAGYGSYVENLVTWRRQSVLEMCAYLAERHHKQWHRAFRNRLHISEYTLYGLYVDNIARDAAHHFHDGEKLCRTHWSRRTLSPDEVAQLCANLGAHEVSVGVQSFAGVDMSLLEAQFDRAATARA